MKIKVSGVPYEVEMPDLRKAAEMALEALEDVPLKPAEWSPAVEALRQTLAQPEQEPFIVDRGCWERGCVAYDERDGDGVNISAECVDETAKCEHEPFIYVREDNEKPFGGYEHCSEADAGAFPVYTAPPISDYHEGWEEGFKAAKKEWVGLTDEDLEPMCDDWRIVFGPYVHDFAKAIEAKLKEKNT